MPADKDNRQMSIARASRNATGGLVYEVSVKQIGFVPKMIWCPAPDFHHHTAPYPVPKIVRIGVQDTKEAAARFSPHPFAVVVERGNRKTFIGLGAERGWHCWNFAEFEARRSGLWVHIDMEGHTPLSEARRHIQVFVMAGRNGESSHDLLRRGHERLYPSAWRESAWKTPAWWKRPIYCGYGDQCGIALELEGPGCETRSMAYCIQGLYERWVDRLEQAGVPIGTVTVDVGWSQGGVWKPNPVQWPDLRGFIARQHAKGRRVLLWIATWYHEGLPAEWCIHARKIRLVADPTNADYRAFVRTQVLHLLSANGHGFDADGFKIDQRSYVPCERQPRGGEHFDRSFRLPKRHPRIKFRGKKWGCELLYELQELIYDAAKSAKPDALVSSSTVHPYFHDTFDMVRLHDTGCVEADIFQGMKARADLARSVLPRHPIDADNWVTTDYGKWLSYTMESHRIGVPCIFYAERFVRSFGSAPTIRRIPMKDLEKVAECWTKRRW